VDDVDEGVLAVARVDRLDRRHIAAYARGRFSTERMVWLYEQAYATVMAARAGPRTVPTATAATSRLRVIDQAEELDEPA
ncbi:MAG: hypothetical protein ABI725_07455, partial [Chloroflexota bacterium]